MADEPLNIFDPDDPSTVDKFERGEPTFFVPELETVAERIDYPADMEAQQ